MAAMARSAMTQMAGMHVPVAVPTWMRTLVRAGWALAVELPLLALILLWRRRRHLPDPARRAAAVVLLGGVAVTHASDWLDKLWGAPYLAVGFGLLIVGSGVAAVGMATMRRTRLVEHVTAIVCCVTVAGYLASRSVGLPQLASHVGHWADPWGSGSLVAELGLVLLVWRPRWPRLHNLRTRVGRAVAVRGARMSRPRWVIALVATAASIAAVLTGLPSEAAAKPHVLLVCNGTSSCPHAKGVSYYHSLQLAVAHAGNGDWILVWPGKYDESTTVQPGHGLTSGLHIRGMNRNGVVFDGKKTGGSAVHVLGVNNT